MTPLKSVTKRNIAYLLALTLIVVAFALCAGLFFLIAHRSHSLKAASFTLFGVEALLFSFMPVWFTRTAKRRKAQRAQWLEDYKASPESHILRLND